MIFGFFSSGLLLGGPKNPERYEATKLGKHEIKKHSLENKNWTWVEYCKYPRVCSLYYCKNW